MPDTSVVTDVYQEQNSSRILSQAGGGAVFELRRRVTIAEINAGLVLLTARANRKLRLIDAKLIAIGGAVGGATTVDILGTQAAGSVKLLAVAIAALTQSAVVRAGAANATVLADGASFVANDVNTAISIGKTGGDATTATHVDVSLSYAHEI